MTNARPAAAGRAGNGGPDGRPVRTPRRSDALSRSRIVQAAIEILDAGGESALTARTLTDHLRTGRGAIYHHVSGLPELVAAAAQDVIVTALPQRDTGATAVNRAALDIFEAITAHPWVAAQLGRDPAQPAVLHIWTAIGRALDELGVSGRRRADAGAALTNYILGAAAQYVAGPGRGRDPGQRREYLDSLAATWVSHDEGAGDAAAQLREHDDRAQFVAGLEIFLRGIRADAAAPTRNAVDGAGGDG